MPATNRTPNKMQSLDSERRVWPGVLPDTSLGECYSGSKRMGLTTYAGGRNELPILPF